MITIGILYKAVIGTFMGRAVAIGLAALVALGINNYHQRNFGKKQLVQASKKEGAKRNAKVRKKRAKTEKPGSASRLLKSACRDC